MADEQQQPAPQQLDIRSYIENEGGKILDVRGNVAEVELGGRTVNLDISQMIKDGGLDPAQYKPVLSTPERPLDTNSPMNFRERWNYSFIDSKNDKHKYLKEQFGPENVKYNPNIQDFVVKDSSEQWKPAGQAGFFADLTGKDALVIGGGILGAAAGSVIPVAGTTAGAALGATGAAALGASIGAVVGRLSTLSAAHMAGLRTEEDAGEVAKMLGWDAAFAVAGETVPAALIAGGAKAAKIAERTFTKLGDLSNSPVVKDNIASLLSAMNRAPKDSVRTAIDHPKDVFKYANQQNEWQAIGAQVGERNPIREMQAEQVYGAVDQIKSKMMQDYDNVSSSLAGVLKKTEVPMGDQLNSISSMYKEMGLIDAEGKWLGPKAAGIDEVARSADRNKLKEVYDVIQKAVQVEQTAVADSAGILTERGVKGSLQNPAQSVLSFADNRKVVDNLDDILKAMGAYGGNEAAVVQKYAAKIGEIRNGLNNNGIKALSEVDAKAAKTYSEMNAKYSGVRNWMDQITAGDKLDDFHIDGLVKKLVNPQNDALTKSFRDQLQNIGKDPDSFIRNLKVLQASTDVAPLVSKGKGMTMGLLTSPRYTTKLSAASLNQLNKIAHGADYIRSLDAGSRNMLVRSTSGLNALAQVVGQAAVKEDMLTEQLTQEGLGLPQQQ